MALCSLAQEVGAGAVRLVAILFHIKELELSTITNVDLGHLVDEEVGAVYRVVADEDRSLGTITEDDEPATNAEEWLLSVEQLHKLHGLLKLHTIGYVEDEGVLHGAC